jgi:hypothetical protein
VTQLSTGKNHFTSGRQKEKNVTEPDWSIAPSWAMWFAINVDGRAWWYGTEPKLSQWFGCWVPKLWEEKFSCEYEFVGLLYCDDWEQSLRQRPTGE